ncbi:MAG: ABC transporter permease [Angelakisella sp.]
MKQYIIRRVLVSLLVLWGVSVLLYGLIRMMPSDYVQNVTSGNTRITAEMKENMRRIYGLDEGIVEGYVQWLGKAVTGDMGISFAYNLPVTKVIGKKMWNSFALAATAFVIELMLAIPLGILSATKQYSKIDYALTGVAIVGISVPSFFLAAVLQRIFAIGLKWVPLSGMITAREDYEGFRLVLDMGWHFILPICVLAITSIGALMRYTRTNMLEVLNADYIRTARAKGLSEHSVIYTHAFRNTLIPLVTLVGGMIPGLFAGAIITETVFAIDGIGKTAFDCLKLGDIPFVMGFNMFLAVLTLIGTLFSDILYAVVDPRVRYS